MMAFPCDSWAKWAHALVQGQPFHLRPGSLLMLTQGWDQNCLYILPPSSAATKTKSRNFPGGPVVKTPAANARGMGSIPSQGTKISYATVQFSCPVISDSLWPQDSACQASLSINNSRRLLKLMSIKSVMPSNHLILCHPLLPPPSIFPSIRVFSNELLLPRRWPKYWSFSFSISPSNEYSGLISFRMDWLDLLAV